MNYGDKHTEDSLVSRLGRLYGIERGLDCGPNIIMDRYWKIWDGGERQDQYSGYYEADFLYITNGYYLCNSIAKKQRKGQKSMSSIKPAFVNMEQRERINNIVCAAEHLEEVIKQNCPKGRARKTALRKLEEVAMWANKAIAFEVQQ